MPGFQAPHGGTIPPHVLVTSLRPDIFLLNESSRESIIFELTCPWDNNVDRSHSFKEEKYSPLVADLSRNYTVSQFSVEITVRGQITKANRARLKSFAYKCCDGSREVTKSLLKNCSKASLLCSYSIFTARKEPSWTSPPSLIVRWIALLLLISMDITIFFIYPMLIHDNALYGPIASLTICKPFILGIVYLTAIVYFVWNILATTFGVGWI